MNCEVNSIVKGIDVRVRKNDIGIRIVDAIINCR